MQIREARMGDLDRVVEIESICFPPAEAAPRESMRARLASYPDHFWLACEGGEVAAFLNGLVTDEEHLRDEMFADASMHDERGAWQMIFGLATVPEHRCRGIAGALLRHVEARAREQDRRGVVLTCKDRLVPYYAKFGYADEGISGSQHGGASWHEMRLVLSSSQM